MYYIFFTFDFTIINVLHLFLHPRFTSEIPRRQELADSPMACTRCEAERRPTVTHGSDLRLRSRGSASRSRDMLAARAHRSSEANTLRYGRYLGVADGGRSPYNETRLHGTLITTEVITTTVNLA